MLAKKPTGVYRDPNSLNFGQAEGRIKRIFFTYTISKHQEPSIQMLNGRKAHKNLKEIRYLIALDKSKISSPPPTTPNKKQCSKKCNTMVIGHNVAGTQQKRIKRFESQDSWYESSSGLLDGKGEVQSEVLNIDSSPGVFNTWGINFHAIWVSNPRGQG